MIFLECGSPEFENDIRALLMAFFTGEKISTSPCEWEKHLRITLSGGMILARIEENGRESLEKSAVSVSEGYRSRKDILKTLVYELLSAFTGKTLPWGTLTGVRPAKIVMERIERGQTPEKARDYLTSHYLVSEDKAALCSEVAVKEKAILDQIDYEKGYSLYVGIPFCPSICAYCSFSSYPLSVWKDRVDEYLDALSREIRTGAQLLAGRKPLTFYMGGGTPTTLSAAQMDRLLGELEERFDFSEALEMTVEAGRPDSITPEKLSVLRKHGIRRISINPQSMNQETLDLIGRRHTVQDVVCAFEMARDQGFENINMDLIAGLPGERAEHMQRTMDAVCALRPDSITVHSLALKRAAFLNQNRELFPVAETGEVNRMIAISRQCSAQIGLSPYYLYRQKNIAGNLENVGYAREGCEGVYNILIMEEKQTILALGAGASSKFVFPAPDGTSRIERVMNVKSVSDYIGRIDEMISRKETFCSKNRVGEDGNE